MALDKQQNHLNGQKRLQTGLLAILMTSALVSVSSAQTVVIGGGNSEPVTVNMSGTNGGNSYVLQRRHSPFLTNSTIAATQPTVDFSKEAVIRYGNELIKLVPPGSQPKKREKPIVAAKPKPKTVPKVVVEKAVEPAPKPKTVVEKVEAPKPEPEQKPALAAKPAPLETQPAPKVAAAKPAATETEKPKATEPAAPTTPELAQKPTPKPANITPSAPPATTIAKDKTPTEPEKEIQVAAVAPKETSEPVDAKPKIQPIAKEDSTDTRQILFEEGETKLPSSASGQLGALAKSIADNDDRIQLVAYANASSNGTARRISLGRALVIRSKLMELGVPNNKIEVRALGLPNDDSPADRVDLKLVAR